MPTDAPSFAVAVRDQAAGRVRPPVTKGAPDPIIAEARTRWARCDEHESKQRARILTAKKFRAGEQWPEAVRLQREGASAIQGQAAQPPRPCLTIDRLSQPLRQVSNTIRTANFAIEVLPNGHGADDETAAMFTGYLRRVQAQCRETAPVEWAADQAIEGGIGWFRIRTEFVHRTWDGPPDETVFDQEVLLERITNNLTVYCDPSAVAPTRSDARFMLVTEDLSKDEFRSRWPKADVRGLEDLASEGDLKGWVTEDSIRIAEYWTVTFADQVLHLLADGSVVPDAGVPEGVPIVQTRTLRRPVVKGYKISAAEILEQWEWVGSRIPIIPVLGEELNVDGQIILRGLIEEGMDAQRMVNYTYSGAMEIFALGPKAPYVAAAGQIDPYLDIWRTANTFNYAYLPYEPVSIGGEVLPPPQRQTSEAPIQAAVLLMQKSEEAIHATTGYYEPSLGQTDPKAHSGRAIQALQGQAETGSSNYADNVRRALIYAGEQLIEIIPKITRQGQLLQILGTDDQPEQVLAGVPFKHERGQAVPAAPDEHAQGLAQFFDLNTGRYAVTVDVGKAQATKREQGAAAIGELIPHMPPAMAAVATVDFVRELSFPGAQGLADKLEKTLPPELQPKPEGEIPPQIQAQLDQLQRENQQLQQMVHLDQAKEQAQTERELQKATMQAQIAAVKADADNAAKIAIAKIEAETKLTTAQIQAQMAGLGHQIARLEQMIGADHELHVQARDHEHEAAMAVLGQQHAQALASQQHAQGLEGQAAEPQEPAGE